MKFSCFSAFLTKGIFPISNGMTKAYIYRNCRPYVTAEGKGSKARPFLQAMTVTRGFVRIEKRDSDLSGMKAGQQ